MDRKPAIALAGVLALAIGGCGGSEPLTKAELISQADKTCKQMDAKTQTAFRQVGKRTRGRASEAAQQEGLAFLLREVTAARREALEQLEGLDPSDAQKANYDAFVDARRTTLKLLPTSVEAMQSNNDPDAKEREAAERQAARLAAKIGFKTCR